MPLWSGTGPLPPLVPDSFRPPRKGVTCVTDSDKMQDRDPLRAQKEKELVHLNDNIDTGQFWAIFPLPNIRNVHRVQGWR